ncbi:hypothetical protein [Streptomyces sp. NPDC056464]|uniref:hypothetical protein n=1 Tax=Streptomyces sp. NPDC056464 TaxID=3345828 RepID=UPI00368CF3C5
MPKSSRPASVRAGAWVRFAGQVRTVLAVCDESVRVTDQGGSPREVRLEILLGDADFDVLGNGGRMPLPHESLLEEIPEQARERALWWEVHILEVLHGFAPGADAEAGPRPEYDPARRSLTARELAKATELTGDGWPVGMSTVGNLRRRYQAEGLLGLVDRRRQTHKKPQSK